MRLARTRINLDKGCGDTRRLSDKRLRSGIEAEERIKTVAGKPRPFAREKLERIGHNNSPKLGAATGRDCRSLTLGVDDKNRSFQMREVWHDERHALAAAGRPNRQEISFARIT